MRGYRSQNCDWPIYARTELRMVALSVPASEIRRNVATVRGGRRCARRSTPQRCKAALGDALYGRLGEVGVVVGQRDARARAALVLWPLLET